MMFRQTPLVLLAIACPAAGSFAEASSKPHVVGEQISISPSVSTDGSVGAASTGLRVSGTLSGSSANLYGPFAAIVATDYSKNTRGAGANQALLTQFNIAPSAGSGSKSSITSILNFSGGPLGPQGGFYTSVFGQTYLNGGKLGVEYGDFYGMAALVQAGCNCSINGVTGEEVDVGLFPQTKAKYKYGLRVVGVNGDNTHAVATIIPSGYGVFSGQRVTQEAMIGLARDANTKIGWYCGICFGSVGVYWPIDETGTIVGVQPVSLVNLQSGTASPIKAQHGVDFSAVSFSGDFLKSKGFFVGPGGYTSAARYNAPLHTPSSSSETCITGDFADDENYHYVCVEANKWKRVALSPF